jgi:hypothetical protein
VSREHQVSGDRGWRGCFTPKLSFVKDDAHRDAETNRLFYHVRLRLELNKRFSGPPRLQKKQRLLKFTERFAKKSLLVLLRRIHVGLANHQPCHLALGKLGTAEQRLLDRSVHVARRGRGR